MIATAATGIMSLHLSAASPSTITNGELTLVKNHLEESIDIQITEAKYGFQQKENWFQKVFWVVIATFLIAGLLGLLSDDRSLIGAMLVVATLVTMDVLFSVFSLRSGLFNKLTSGVPVVILESGKSLKDRMKRLRVEVDDILESARRVQGLESLD